MGKVSKIIVTIVCVIVFIALSGVVSGIRSDAGFATGNLRDHTYVSSHWGATCCLEK